MRSLRFTMNLKRSEKLLLGKLELLEGEKVLATYETTSGLPGCQAPECQSWRGRGPLPACRQAGLTSYHVRTTPFDERNVAGVGGNFYYIEPDPVDIHGVRRGEFGIHLDANAAYSPGSSGCIVFRKEDDWKAFQAAMAELKRTGMPTIPLVVSYDRAAAPAPAKRFLKVTSPSPGASLKANTSASFTGDAEPEVALIIATIGPAGPFKIGEVAPENGRWKFTQTLVSPGVRDLRIRALDEAGNLLDTAKYQVTVTP